FPYKNLIFYFSVALAAASGRIELPVQSTTYPSSIIDIMLAMLQTEPNRRPSITEIIENISNASRLVMNIV
ncbi:unnamed protein product, partial [Rotaria sp. Silwood1]